MIKRKPRIPLRKLGTAPRFRRRGPAYPFTHTTCFRVCSTSTRSD